MEKLYTGCGDCGYTKNANGEKIPKNAPIIELIGTLDEFLAVLGIARTYASDGGEIEKIQSNVFYIMGELSKGNDFSCEELIEEAEKKIDEISRGFEGFKTFGENRCAAYLNLARCVIRRGERIAAGIPDICESPVFVYLNRLSDLIYAMSVKELRNKE